MIAAAGGLILAAGLALLMAAVAEGLTVALGGVVAMAFGLTDPEVADSADRPN